MRVHYGEAHGACPIEASHLLVARESLQDHRLAPHQSGIREPHRCGHQGGCAIGHSAKPPDSAQLPTGSANQNGARRSGNRGLGDQSFKRTILRTQIQAPWRSVG